MLGCTSVSCWTWLYSVVVFAPPAPSVALGVAGVVVVVPVVGWEPHSGRVACDLSASAVVERV